MRSLRRAGRLAAKLGLHQRGMIEIEMHVPALPDDLAGLEIGMERQHPRDEREAEDVERETQAHIA